MIKSILLLLLTLTVVHAFAPNLRAPTTTTTTTTTVVMNAPPLNQIDEMCIENVAEFCLEDAMACDLEEFEALVNQLTEQRAYHTSQVTLLDTLLDKLSGRRDFDGTVTNGVSQPSP